MSKNQKIQNQNFKNENQKREFTKEQSLAFIERKKLELTPETLMQWGKFKGTSLLLFWENPTDERRSYINWLQSKIKLQDYNYYLLDYIEDHMKA